MADTIIITLTYEEAKLIKDLAYWGLGAARQPLPPEKRMTQFTEHATALNDLSEMLEKVKADIKRQEEEARDQENQEGLQSNQ